MHQHIAVLEVVDAYCRAVYQGDTDLLRRLFDPLAVLFAEVRGETHARPVEQYLALVAGRQSPESLGQAFSMKTIGVEVTHEIAFAKVHCPMFDYNYIDYLSLVRRNGDWKIVNKTFTDLPA